jgi:hypothetical protein
MDFPATGFEDVAKPHKEIMLRTWPWEKKAKWIALEGK